MTAISDVQAKQFEEEGYVVVDDLLDPELDLKPVEDEYTRLLDRLCDQWSAEGKLSTSYSRLGFGEKLAKVMNEGDLPYYQYLDISGPGSSVAANAPVPFGPAVFSLLRHQRLLDAVERFVGPEIYSNPIQHVRIKPPEKDVPDSHRNTLVAQTGWHQDQGVALPEADNTNLVSVWFPMHDTDAENGCLMVVPRSHISDMIAHCPDLEKKQRNVIPERLIRIEDARPLPMKAGSVMFFTRTTIHQSLPNVSDRIRWSFDLRYQPTGQPTGRPAFPGFVARSRRDPASELRDSSIWADLWRQARSKLADQGDLKFRWDPELPVCG